MIPQWADAIANEVESECGQTLSPYTLGRISRVVVDARANGLKEAAKFFDAVAEAMPASNPRGRFRFNELAKILRILAEASPGEFDPLPPSTFELLGAAGREQ